MYLGTEDKKKMLKVYYFFIMADGVVEEKEKQKFDKIVKTLEADEDEKKEAVNYCKAALFDGISTDIIIKELKEVLDIKDEEEDSESEIKMHFLTWGRSALENFTERVKMMWNLVNLGYIDGKCTESEREILDFLAKSWKFDEVAYKELLDSAETMLALEKKKEWLKTTKASYDEIDTGIKNIDKKIKQLFKTVEISLNELVDLNERSFGISMSTEEIKL